MAEAFLAALRGENASSGGGGGGGGGSSSSSSGALEVGGSDYVVGNAPHTLKAPEVDYTVVIPTYGRWRPAKVINPIERELARDTRPFILVKTLAFLARHRVPPSRVHLFVADASEHAKYKKALAGTAWDGVKIVEGVRGIMAQRNFIVKYFPPGQYICSIDDDVSDIVWKAKPGWSDALRPLPDGALHALICDAFDRMRKWKAYICGLNASRNPQCMHLDGLSTRNGELNGFFYCFRNRHCDELLPTVADATEDAERSLRYFRKDGKILRYRMYAGTTRCFQNLGGLQSLFGEFGAGKELLNSLRKKMEREAAVKLHRLFPELALKPREKKSVESLEVRFSSKGGAVIPSADVADYERHREMDAEASKGAPAGGDGGAAGAAGASPSSGRPGGRARRRRRKGQPGRASTSAATPPRSDGAPPEPPMAPSLGSSPRPGAAPAPAQPPAPARARGADERGEPSAADDGSASEGEEDADSDDAEDEDVQFLSMFRQASSNPQMVARHGGDTVAAAVWLSWNGNFADPVAAAMEASEAAYKREQEREAAYERELKEALERSACDGVREEEGEALAREARQAHDDRAFARALARTALLDVGCSPPRRAAAAGIAPAAASPALLRRQPAAKRGGGSTSSSASTSAGTSPSPALSRKRPRMDDAAPSPLAARGVDGQSSGGGLNLDAFQEALSCMGFKMDGAALRSVYRDSGGSVSLAVAMLVSAS